LASMGLGQFEEARAALNEARELYASNKNTTFAAIVDSYLAELALRRADASEASARAERALAAFTRQKLTAKAAHARLLTARAAYLVGDSANARRKTNAALNAIEGRFAPSVSYMCHHLIGKIARDKGNHRAALAGFRRAVEVIEQMRS